MPSPTDVLGDAMSAHKQGRFDEAEAGYRSVLRERPNDPKALYYLGLLHFHRGDTDSARKCIYQCLVYAPGNGSAWNTLGSLLVAAGRAADAKAAYRRVTEVSPSMAEGWYNLGICLRNESEFDEAVNALHTALARDPDYFRAHEALAMLLYELGRTGEAAEVYAQWSLHDPANAKARHMAAATSNRNVPDRAPDGYVQNLFDSSAAGFDDNLEKLGYRAPSLVATALAGYSKEPASLVVLDGGCGTGLCGPLIRAQCSRLIGVDLSGKMIEQARARGVYDELVTAELCAFMRTRPSEFDAVLLVDTLVYFGALDEPLRAAHGSLRASATVIFTVEILAAEDGTNHKLEAHGRYTHAESYVRSALLSAGFALESLTHETLRQERLQDVPGYLVVARRHT
ncbi:MAG: tetratricopeptide repeat protein [Gammaproteobacteria bacterium]